jgi:hypothetical protein
VQRTIAARSTRASGTLRRSIALRHVARPEEESPL